MDPEVITAIRSGDGGQIRKLSMDKAPLLEKTSPQDNTVLHIAVRYGNSSVVREILKFQDSFLFARNCKGETPLHLAAVFSDCAVGDVLLAYKDWGKGENGEENILRIPDNAGNIPLHVAVKNNSYQMVRYMLSLDPELVRCINEAGQSPLSIAIDLGFFKSAYSIIRSGPEGYVHEENLTKLLRAFILSKKMDFYRVRLWIEYVMEEQYLNDTDEKGRNPLHYAAVAGNDYITEELLQVKSSLAYNRDRDGQTPLHLAVRNGQLNSLKNLINTCPDATEVLDHKNRNILHIAAEYGQVNIVLYLLRMRELEDFINSCDEYGNTPLHLAAMNFKIDVINILLKNDKVRIRATNEQNQTALQVATEASEDQKKTFKKHLTMKALKAAYADQALEDTNGCICM